MKNLVVCGIVLLLVVLGPQHDLHSRFDALWALGTLVLVAHVLQEAARYLRLPSLVGWLGAGLLLGPSGLQVAQPADFPALLLGRTLAALWVGFQVGIHFSWPPLLDWKGPGLIGLVTLATALLATTGIALIAQPPWWLAVLLGAIASLWGPFTSLPAPERRGELLLGVMGTGFSLVLLSIVLGFLQVRGLLPAAVLHLIGRLWLSLLVGACSVEVLRRFGLFAARASTLAVGLFGALFVVALFVQHLQLYALPGGFAAGLALVPHRVPARRTRYLLRLLPPIPFMVFFALMGATIDLGILRFPVDGFFETLLVLVLIQVFVRGVGPAVYYPLPAPDPQARRRLGWLLLPRGALLFELLYHPRSSLLDLLGEGPARLVHQVALGDILVHVVVFSSLAIAVQRLRPPPSISPETSAPEPAPTA